MRNDCPQPIQCAVCGRIGPVALFMTQGALNWVEHDGRAYVVCNAHIHSVSVRREPGLHGHPFVHESTVFYADPTMRDLEQRIDMLDASIRALEER